MKPNVDLLRFQKATGLPVDSKELFYRLLEEAARLKKELAKRGILERK